MLQIMDVGIFSLRSKIPASKGIWRNFLGKYTKYIFLFILYLVYIIYEVYY